MDDSPPRPAGSSPKGIEEAFACPLLEGRDEAWIRCCTARFLPLARRITGDDAVAHDALQESWISVLKSVQKYRGDPPACAWVAAIVRNESLRQRARKRPHASFDDEEGGRKLLPVLAGGPNPEEDENARQMRRILLELVTRLPPIYREIIRLRDLEERPPDEVAARLHISRSSVSSRLHRAHDLLRRSLLRRLDIDPHARS